MKILIALPVYNEELVLEKNTNLVLNWCQNNITPNEFQIIIADNNSHDSTKEIGEKLATELLPVEYFFTPISGKGNAWREAFLKYNADIYIVMDVDLAVEIDDTKLLIQAINGGADMTIGSRFLDKSKVERSAWRELSSRTYRLLAQTILNTKTTDFQCGFKAINQKIKETVLPLTKDNGFFLDTELIILSEKLGYKLAEVPVNWSEFRNEKRKSTVNVLQLSLIHI